MDMNFYFVDKQKWILHNAISTPIQLAFFVHHFNVLLLSTELHFSTDGVLLDGPYLKKIKI
ncbi:hypothetical protein T08_5982 [Trichinella sp. T8]|nr:hypothetical protein T08_5982 [Trichinella sp. T8]